MANAVNVRPEAETVPERRRRERRTGERRAPERDFESERRTLVRREADRNAIARRRRRGRSQEMNGRDKRTFSRAVFAASLGTTTFVLGTLSLYAAYLLREGSVCTGFFRICHDAEPYLTLLPFAGAIRAFLAVRRRPWTKRRPHGFFEETGEAIRDAALGTVAIVLFTFFFRSGYHFRGFSYSRLVFVFDWVFATGLSLAVAIGAKAVLSRMRRSGHDQRNVVVVSSTRSTRPVRDVIDRFPEMGYQLVGRIEVDQVTAESTSALQGQLLQLATECEVDEVLLLLPRINHAELSQLVSAAELAHIDIKAVPEIFGLPPTKVSLGQFGNLPVLGLLEEPLPGGRRVVKRTMDIIVSSILLALTAPAQALIATLVRLSSPGPILVRQTRVGMDGRPFEFLKFRTMYVDVDGQGHKEYMSALIRGTAEPTGDDAALFKLTDDPRVTSVGRFLRKYSLDELPQLINVLRG
ncbi:MAG: sugar transferase, partial [Actinomycetota bacterium]|nr:sugar transferase [Actinomycetota bacterium]